MPRRRILIIEVLVVLTLFLLPNLTSGIRSYLDPNYRGTLTYAGTALLRMMNYVSVVPAVVFIAWRSGKDLKQFGLSRFRWWSGLLLAGATVFFGLLIVQMIARMAFYWLPSIGVSSAAQFARVRLYPKSDLDYLLMGFSVFMGSFAEEFIMRGYLITRLKELLPGPWTSVVVSSILFASYHIYQGPVALVTVFTLGLLFSGLFLVTRSIWPGTLAHAAYNILAQTVIR